MEAYKFVRLRGTDIFLGKRLTDLRASLSLLLNEHFWYSFLLDAERVSPRAIVVLEGLCKLKKFNNLIGTRASTFRLLA
jgi:hypothetical protein